MSGFVAPFNGSDSRKNRLLCVEFSAKRLMVSQCYRLLRLEQANAHQLPPSGSFFPLSEPFAILGLHSRRMTTPHEIRRVLGCGLLPNLFAFSPACENAFQDDHDVI